MHLLHRFRRTQDRFPSFTTSTLIVLGIFFVKFVVRHVTNLFFTKSIYALWIGLKESIEFCNNHKIKYYKSAPLYITIAAISLTLVVRLSVNSYLYWNGVISYNNFVCLSCLCVIDVSYFACIHEYLFLISLMSSYLGEIDAALKNSHRNSKLIGSEGEYNARLKGLVKCYIRVCEVVTLICRNFALPAVLSLGEIILILLIHTHNILLRTVYGDKSDSLFFKFEVSLRWVYESVILMAYICGTSYICQKRVSIIRSKKI